MTAYPSGYAAYHRSVIHQQKSKMNFFSKILNEFPNLEEEFKEAEENEIHYKMERIAEYINKCIKERNEAEVFLCFDIIERFLKQGVEPKFENALNVSFCESILLLNNEQDKSWAIILMKAKLKTIYSDYQEHYEKTFK